MANLLPSLPAAIPTPFISAPLAPPRLSPAPASAVPPLWTAPATFPILSHQEPLLEELPELFLLRSAWTPLYAPYAARPPIAPFAIVPTIPSL